MKLVVVVVVAVVAALSSSPSDVEAYMPSAAPRGSFVSRSSSSSSRPLAATNLRMDSEADETVIDYTARYNLEQILLQEAPSTISLEEAQAEHGMPWKTSIDKKAFQDEDLLYMKFWEHHVEFLKENLTDLKVVSCTNGETDFSYNDNKSKKARIVNLCFTSKEYRKIRLTYYDAGDNTQVYNAVCYPDPKYNLPILGVDLLAFNRKKYLAIVDFQPLHEDESQHDVEFTPILQPIKESYENLSGRMSSKFYDETQFFSQQMLFSRFEDESIIDNELFPAFQQYVSTHLDLIRNQDGDADVQQVLERQQAYDTYSAERDPATGLFTAMFGQEWAMDYVHDFLFSMSQRPAPGTPPVMPAFMGGGGPPNNSKKQQQGGGNPFANSKVGGKNPAASSAASSHKQPVVAARRR